MMDADACIFCRILAGEAPASFIWRDKASAAFMDILPATCGHALVIPVRHAVTIWEMTDEEIAAVFRTAGRVARAIREVLQPPGLSLLQSNGRAAGQEVFHFHVHLIPRYGDDPFRVRLRGPDAARPPREELEAQAMRLRAAIQAPSGIPPHNPPPFAER